MPKSKRLRVDEASSENDDDFQLEEVAVVDVQGASGSQRLGFGRDGVSRDQLAAIRQAFVGGAARASPRTHKAQGFVITEARVHKQAAGVGEVTVSGVHAPIVPVAGGGRLDKAVIGADQLRQALPAQKAGGSSATITPPPQKKVDAGGSKTVVGDHHTSASGVAEGVVEGKVDDVHREDGKRDGRREGDDDDERPLASRRKRTAKEVNMEERSKLWVGPSCVYTTSTTTHCSTQDDSNDASPETHILRSHRPRRRVT
ncbi:hypothetical protein CBR_g24438 [Chara braunii]|uniref:Uncharacterized protein n=1 Tax=Chara braunii TaxID=69332 RepID=A0A388JMV7_CHABU|nr:hypothetical protein CBR_g24438 [Chara braunii]|eukprot:GBG59095.1 hypothetical protein CBR_g24438 [Chara braunii]